MKQFSKTTSAAVRGAFVVPIIIASSMSLSVTMLSGTGPLGFTSGILF